MKKITRFALVLAAWVTVSPPSWGFFSFISDAQFCLVQCKADYCASSQENFDACQNRCKGRYQGVIKNCNKAALAQGYAPIMLAAAPGDEEELSDGEADEESKSRKRKKRSSDDPGDDEDHSDKPKRKKKNNKKKSRGGDDEEAGSEDADDSEESSSEEL